MQKRFIKPAKLEKYVLARNVPLNALQVRVLSQLTEYVSDRPLQLSRAALGYLFDEIQGDKATDIPPERAAEVLTELLSETEKYRGNDLEVSLAVVVRTLREYKCPRPWC